MDNGMLVVGDAYEWDTNVAGFPANGGWTFKIRFVGISASGTPFTLTSVPVGETHRITVPSATSANWVAGEYGWHSYVENGAGERHTVADGSSTIKPNPTALPAGTDQRSHAKKMLDAIEAVLEGRATSDMSSYMVSGRQVILLSPEALIKWKGHYKALVLAEERRNGVGRSGLRVKFNNG